MDSGKALALVLALSLFASFSVASSPLDFIVVTISEVFDFFSSLLGGGNFTMEVTEGGGSGGVLHCGDCVCGVGENHQNCPNDCSVCNEGDLELECYPPAPNCPYFCPACAWKECGDGTCNALHSENCASCPRDCGSCTPPCGNGGCEPWLGELCDNCPADCGPCCGNGYCGGLYNSVPEDCYNCPTDCGVCPLLHCGDGKCDPFNESSLSCPLDCGCGNGYCGDIVALGVTESCSNCPQDCGACNAPSPCNNNNACDLGETCATCSQDCGSCPLPPPPPPPVLPCGDGSCNSLNGEACATCPQDCGTCCGQGGCQPHYGETCATCSPDCGSCPPLPSCGDGACLLPERCEICPQDCGPCPPLPGCGNGACEGFLGEVCATCPQDCGACPPLPSCGDGACLLPETCATCPNDCGSCPLPYCGDSHCQGVLLGETCATCPSDCCSLCGDRVCDGAFYGETCATCPQDCGNCVTSCSSFNSLSCGSSCQDCTQTHGVGAVCNGGVCSCPPETTSCRDSLTGVRFCTAPRADPRNCGGCSALGSVPQGENCLDKQEVCYLGNCGVTACTTNSNCSALGTAYKCCGTAGTSVKACTNVNSQASVVNCGACGNACGQGGNAGRPFCCPSGGTYACSSAPCPPPI